MARRLEIVGFNYEHSSGGLLRQGAKGHRIPVNAVQGGCGSYIVADPPKIQVRLRDVDTGEEQTVNMYLNFKSMIYPMRMSERRAQLMVERYRELGVFEAQDWDTWPEIPNISLGLTRSRRKTPKSGAKI